MYEPIETGFWASNAAPESTTIIPYLCSVRQSWRCHSAVMDGHVVHLIDGSSCSLAPIGTQALASAQVPSVPTAGHE